MDQHQVNVVQAHFRQRPFNGLDRLIVGFDLCRQFGGYKELLAGNAAGSNSLADAALVSIGLRCIDVPVPDPDSVSDSLCCLTVLNKPGTQPQFGDLHAV